MRTFYLFYGTVRGGRFIPERLQDMKALIAKYEGKEITFAIKPASEIRSNSENAYYWAVIVRDVAKAMAILPDEAHDFLKGLFLKVGVEVQGKRFEIFRSTTSLSIAEFEEYCENCRQWASQELQIVIPLPNEIIIDDEYERTL